MNYEKAIEYLYENFPMFSKEGLSAYKPGLETSLRLAALYDNPHEKFRSIHVGGTNGKGTTAHLIASVLQEQGYRVGLYTSPHLTDFRERMRINGEMIPKEKVVEFLKTLPSRISQDSLSSAQDSPIRPSFFEVTMMMAFDWFANEKVDYAVVEVGLGGRLDSTNIITPQISVITNISLDHTQILGDTLGAIAAEKAGIIKRGVPVVIGEMLPETTPVFMEKAKETGSEIITPSGHYMKAGDRHFGDSGWSRENVGTVLAALDVLKRQGVEISDIAVKDGIEKVKENTGLTGRWMKLSDNPFVIADGGHNPAALALTFAKLQSLMKDRPGGTLRMVIGFMADKAVDKITGMVPPEAEYYAVNAPVARALSSELLWKKMKTAGLNARTFDSVKEGYEAAKREASEKDIIFIGGSFSVVGDILNHLSFPQ